MPLAGAEFRPSLMPGADAMARNTIADVIVASLAPNRVDACPPRGGSGLRGRSRSRRDRPACRLCRKLRHLINGLYDCQRNHVPVLTIAAHIPSSEIGLGYFQETHPQDLFRECSHFVELVSNPAQMPEVLHRAVRTAIGKRGVAVIVIPGDVACAGRHR